MEETKECSTELIPAPTHELYVSVDGGERQFVRSFTLAQEMGDDADEEDDSSMTAGAGAVPVPPPARRFGVCFSPEWRTFKKTAWAVFDTQEEAIQACLMLNNFLRSTFAPFKSTWVASSLASEAADAPIYELRGTIVDPAPPPPPAPTLPATDDATLSTAPTLPAAAAAAAVEGSLVNLADVVQTMQARLRANLYGGGGGGGGGDCSSVSPPASTVTATV